MLGTNPIRKQELTDGKILSVHSVFPTIQGEGPYAGMPAVFVRLWGCNLKCSWCDTEFESQRKEWAADELALYVQSIRNMALCAESNLVVLTGGEPLRQNIIPFIDELVKLGFSCQIETAGSLWVEGLEKYNTYSTARLTIVCSPKTGKVNEQLAQHVSAWKYVIRAGETSKTDGLPNVNPQWQVSSSINQQRLGTVARPSNNAPVYVSPCDDHDDVQNRANMSEAARVAMQFGYRLTLQLHKIVGLD